MEYYCTVVLFLAIDGPIGLNSTSSAGNDERTFGKWAISTLCKMYTEHQPLSRYHTIPMYHVNRKT